jgi:membrane-anchored glycerophosphoryl diester phosphodiesterase (GDPDase)
MWWTRFLCSIVLLFAFLLLIIPGVYLLTRLCFVKSIVVAEHVSGSAAIKRSFEVTKNRFWATFRFGLVTVLLMVVPCAVVILPTVFIPALDHWLIEAASQILCDVIVAFQTVSLLCGYQSFSTQTRSI